MKHVDKEDTIQQNWKKYEQHKHANSYFRSGTIYRKQGYQKHKQK